jgi:predicted DNA-binding transcriptional regulator AlpA
MTDRPKGSIAAWHARTSGLPRDRILGSADVAEKLGVSRQRVSQLRADPTFPSPRMHGWGANVWDAAGIECWAAAHRRSRTSAAGRFEGEGGDLLLAAEAEAKRFDVHWISTEVFWLAVAMGSAGSGLAAAVASVGATQEVLEGWLAGHQSGSVTRPQRSYRMTPHLQMFLAGADRAAAAVDRRRLRAVDILLAFIDADRIAYEGRGKPRPQDHVLAALERRGVDLAELRRRLVAAAEEPASVDGFEQRQLRKPRTRRPKRPPIDIALNPLGHDPWTLSIGAVFARTRDGRHLNVDGEVWFFRTDGDGYYIRATDGRPIGYRYRVDPPPKIRKGQRMVRPVNGFFEVLPMPPVEMDGWPDHRFEIDD